MTSAALDRDLVVVDDFYDDPDAMRRLALAAEYVGFPEAQNFAGRESVKSFYSEAHIQRFSELVGCPIRVDPAQNVFGKFRVSTAADNARTNVHVDDVDWTAVVYLTPDTDARGGLGIYAYIPLDLEAMPDSSDLAGYGCKTPADFDAKYVFPNTHRSECWREIRRVDMKYNRLVLFRGGHRFHGVLELFGESTTSGRLSQNFFFDQADVG